MEEAYVDGDADMEAELDDILGTDSEDDEIDDSQVGQQSQPQTDEADQEALGDDIDNELLDDEEEEEDQLAPSQAPSQTAMEDDEGEEEQQRGYTVEEGYTPSDNSHRYMNVYERADAGAAYAPPDEPSASQYEESGYDHDYPGYDDDSRRPGYDHDPRLSGYDDDSRRYGESGAYNDGDGDGYTDPPSQQPDAAGGKEHDTSEEQKQQRNMQIFKAMTPEQLSRYEAYRRSLCPAPKVKKLMQHIMGANVVIQPQLVLAMRGVAKMFVGEVIECARQVASEAGHSGPLLPCHVQRAYGILESSNKVPRRDGPRSRTRI